MKIAKSGFFHFLIVILPFIGYNKTNQFWKGCRMEIRRQTIEEFTEQLSSKAPTPGGGGASALAGAFGTALGQMVANLTVGKKKYMDVEPEIKELLEEMEQRKERFLRLAEEDARVFEPLAACYRLPSETEEEKAYKEQAMEQHLLAASSVPAEMMKEALRMLEILEFLGEKGSRMAVSDVGVGVQLIRAALAGAVMNVYINTKSMKDRKAAETLNQEADAMLAEGLEKADQIYETVRKGL